VVVGGGYNGELNVMLTYLTWGYAEDAREWPERFIESLLLTGMAMILGKLCSLGM